MERQGIIMAGVGKLSFDDNKLKDNLRAFMIALSNAKPESMKGQYFRVSRFDFSCVLAGDWFTTFTCRGMFSMQPCVPQWAQGTQLGCRI